MRMSDAVFRCTIPLSPVTKKNSQQIFRRPSDGKPFVVPSAKYREYAKAADYFLRPKPDVPIDYPVRVECRFYMPTARKCDLVNLLQCVDDLLVEFGVLKDDNYSIVGSHDGSRVFVDREHPRTEIRIYSAESQPPQPSAAVQKAKKYPAAEEPQTAGM